LRWSAAGQYNSVVWGWRIDGHFPDLFGLAFSSVMAGRIVLAGTQKLVQDVIVFDFFRQTVLGLCCDCHTIAS